MIWVLLNRLGDVIAWPAISTLMTPHLRRQCCTLARDGHHKLEDSRRLSQNRTNSMQTAPQINTADPTNLQTIQSAGGLRCSTEVSTALQPFSFGVPYLARQSSRQIVNGSSWVCVVHGCENMVCNLFSIVAFVYDCSLLLLMKFSQPRFFARGRMHNKPESSQISRDASFDGQIILPPLLGGLLWT